MKIKLIYLYLLTFCGLCFAEPYYQFSPESHLVYSFKIGGDITYKYEGISEEKFNVSSKGIIKLETIEIKDDRYIVKVTPYRTLIKLNDSVLEDITDTETAISQIISTSVIEIKPNGKVMSVKEIRPCILDISQILMLLPAFPEKLNSPWKQTVPAFSIPGIPMSSLTFTYSYSQAKEGISRIQLLANQPIKEERKEKDVVISFTGRNSSKGEFIFDEEKRELKSFGGLVDLILNIVFKVPSSPEQKTSTKQSIPLKIGVKLNIEVVNQN
ncbi:MAG: hypothetical protein NC905_01395 [Candidatus Omnitrophica bacterium]|nr:hypothetical protein [Candidatus Omnitrophota bacterium]MCM8776908.1 hypothetical protein [Candidatus Omnitrophota bacterium]